MIAFRSLLFIVVAMVCTHPASAATVAILRPRSEAPAISEALFRLRGELLAVELSVTVVDRPPLDDTDSAEARAWLERTAKTQAIDAFIDVLGDRAPVGVDVWILERTPAELRHARVVLDADADQAAATLAIRTIEVLRSSFLALEMGGREAVSPPPPARPAPARTPSPPQRRASFGVEIGATGLTSLDGVGLSLLPLARLDWAFSSRFALQITGAAFGTRPRVEAAAGSVDVAQQFALLGLCLCPPSGAGLHPLAALATGALHTALEGQANAPNLGHELERWSLLVDASAGARLDLPERFYLTLATHLQLAAPYVAIHFVDTVVASTGRPNVLLSLTAGARL